MGILEEIIKHKQKEVETAKRSKPLDGLKAEASSKRFDLRGFKDTLQRYPTPPAVIAEIKKQSPSKGILKEDFNVRQIAAEYEANGAAAISVLTDEKFFGGHLNDLREVRQATSCPLLRKDFILDEYQIYESLLGGADAILLIASALESGALRLLYQTANQLGLDVLLEVHTEEEMASASEFKEAVIGINNRDLKTFDVDLETTRKLMAKMPDEHIVISESGIQGREDLDRLKTWGVKGALIGENLMTKAHPGEALKKLLS